MEGAGGNVAAGEDSPLLPVEPGYRNVLRVRYAVTGIVLALVGLVIDRTALEGLPFGNALPIAIAAVGVAAVLIVPQRKYRRLRYRLNERLLQVVRGCMFHTDTVVPLVRVQHLDVVRGPVDKMFGTASLVVHTAGTHNSTVILPGLAPDRAAEMRDIIRSQVRSDFE